MLRPVHATLRTPYRQFFQIPIDQLWEQLLKNLQETLEFQQVSLHAVLLMSNHIHLLFTPKDEPPDLFLNKLADRFVSELSSKAGRFRSDFRLFVNHYTIEHPCYFHRALKYIYRNPVTAGMCERVEEYPYSSLFILLSKGTSSLRLSGSYEYQMMIPASPADLLAWLNKGNINE